MENSSKVSFFLLSILFLKSVHAESLLQVNIYFRHGDRSPARTFQTDPNKVKWDEIGYSQLLPKGKDRAYRFGKWLRRRYDGIQDGFLGRSYHRDDVAVRSSDKDRTLMTAAALLAGLYPPVETTDVLTNEFFNDEIAGKGPGKGVGWQPIPIHTVDHNNDPLLRRGSGCPAYKRMFLDVLKNAPEMIEEETNYANLWNYVKKKTNAQADHVNDLWWIGDNAYIANLTEGMTLPPWTQDIKDGVKIFNHLITYKDLSFKMMGYNQTLQRLGQGNMVNEVRTNMKKMIDSIDHDTKGVKKVYLYSGHDDGISPFLQALGSDIQHPPHYVDAVILELWREGNQDPTVKLYYRNDKELDPPLNQPSRLNIKRDGMSCQNECLLKTFFDMTDAVVPKDFKKECNV